MPETFGTLSEDCAVFAAKSFHKIVHYPLHIVVGEGFLQILKDKTEGILLLSLRDFIAPVNIEERDLLKQFLAVAESCSAQVREVYALILQQCKVSLDLRIFRQFLVGNLVPLHEFEEFLPANFSCKNTLADTELLEQGRCN